MTLKETYKSFLHFVKHHKIEQSVINKCFGKDYFKKNPMYSNDKAITRLLKHLGIDAKAVTKHPTHDTVCFEIVYPKTKVIVDARKADKSSVMSRIYFFDERKKKETIVENIMNRRNRPYKEYRTHLPEVLKKAGIAEEFLQDISWSQNAGCSCGCSPGFFIKGNVGKEIFVTLK